MNKKRPNVLIITGNYYPEISATGICVDNVAKYFVSKKWNVDVVSQSNFGENNMFDYNGYKLYKIPKSKYETVLHNKNNETLFKRMWANFINFLNLYKWPIKSNKTIKRTIKKVKEYNEVKKYDLIVFTVNPPNSLIIAKKLRKIMKNTLFVSYFLDALSGGIYTKLLPQKFVNRRSFLIEKKCLPVFDANVFMESHKKIYNNSKYENIKSKQFFNLPSLDLSIAHNNRALINIDEIKGYNIVFIGTLVETNREPYKIIEFLKDFSFKNKLKINLIFYGNLQGVKIDEFVDEYIKIEHRGIVPHEKSIEILSSADILLNIDNSNSNMTPSKIFEYIAHLKPIISTSSSDESISDYYLKDYPYYQSISFQREFKEIENNLLNFLEKIKNIKTVNKSILQKYSRYTPEEFYNFTLKLLKNNINN